MIEHLVVDSGGFVRNCPIHEMCKNAYTVPGVVAEIKDKQTRQRLKAWFEFCFFTEKKFDPLILIRRGKFPLDRFYEKTMIYLIFG